jgi:hypothetical protein
MYVKALAKITSKYAPSRILSFDSVHVFKVLKLIESKGHVSRNLLCQELALGEGSIKTLLKHMKIQGLLEATKSGTVMTEKGTKISSEILLSIPAETGIPKCSVALGKFNHVVLLKGFGFAVKLGIEQRDAAIKIGALGATTLLFKDGKFVMPIIGTSNAPLKNESYMHKLLIDRLKPEECDVIIIGSDNDDRRMAELAAKNAALMTIMNHEGHHHF